MLWYKEDYDLTTQSLNVFIYGMSFNCLDSSLYSEEIESKQLYVMYGELIYVMISQHNLFMYLLEKLYWY